MVIGPPCMVLHLPDSGRGNRVARVAQDARSCCGAMVGAPGGAGVFTDGMLVKVVAEAAIVWGLGWDCCPPSRTRLSNMPRLKQACRDRRGCASPSMT